MSIGKNIASHLPPGKPWHWRLTRFDAGSTAPVLVLLGAALSSCQQQIANAEQPPQVSSEPTSARVEAQLAAAPAPALEDGLDAENEDSELRRGYGVVDMRANDCIRRKNDHTFQGEACPSGIVIYGPYVPVPANSDIEVSFEVKPSKTIEIYADVVSQMGMQMLAGLNRLTVEAGVNQKLGYKVHVFNADTNVESRIGIDSKQAAQFEITNLTMTIR
jgi:hypothetical protein